ncbi:MAG: alpha/beta fold hydrolase [Spirochaetales bacterium]|nr:alpha/beta fold hydrolase [Spirochaetales bacterium]
MAALKLHHEDLGGSGVPLVILHGLFGSSRNWFSVGRELQKSAHVYALDLRNHGESPHGETHTREDLRGDLKLWFSDHLAEEKPVLLGHSMGGMAAMDFAVSYPDLLRALIVVDIAPRRYPPQHDSEFAALSVDPAGYSSRSEIDQAMAKHVADRSVRQFLQTNLVHKEGGGYEWRINLAALKKAAGQGGLEEPTAHGHFSGPVLVISGSESDYVTADDHAAFRNRFPAVEFREISGAGHWLHHTHQEQFLEHLRSFLKDSAGI